MDVIPGDAGFSSTRTSAQVCRGHGYEPPPETQLWCPTTCAPSSRVRLANAAHDWPWSAPSMLSCCQIIASISAGVLVWAIRR